MKSLLCKAVFLAFACTSGAFAQQSFPDDAPVVQPHDLGIFDCPDGEKICENGQTVKFGQCSYTSPFQICGQCKDHPTPEQLCEAEVALTEDWMRRYSHRSLLDLTLPALHDALMGNIEFPDTNNDCTLGGNRFNARTQTLTPDMMMLAGFRLFDIRPALDLSHNPPRLYSHHGTFESAAGVEKFLGCLGYKIDHMLEATARFLTDHPSEVVILEMTHMRHIIWADPAIGGKASKDQQVAIRDIIQAHLDDFVIKNGDLETLLETPLSDLTNGGTQGRALIIFEGDSDVFTPASGFYEKTSFDYSADTGAIIEPGLFFDDYSNTNSYETLYYGGKNNNDKTIDDQATRVRKAAVVADKSDKTLFTYLDWTLTQSTPQGVACATVSVVGLAGYAACKAAGGSIEDMSEDANWYITKSDGLFNWYAKYGHVPNAVSVDYGTAEIAKKIIEWNTLR